jgi:hypothetical protein
MSPPTFRRNVLTPSSGSWIKPIMKAAKARMFLAVLCFDVQNWGSMFLRNVGTLPRDGSACRLFLSDCCPRAQLITHHTMKTYERMETQLIWMVKFTPRSLHQGGQIPWYPLDGQTKPFWTLESMPHSGTEPRLAACSSWNLAIILSELSQFILDLYKCILREQQCNFSKWGSDSLATL